MALTKSDIIKLRRKYRRKRYVKNPMLETDKLYAETARAQAKANVRRLAIRNQEPRIRKKWTKQEIELMWLGVCRVLEYFGGTRADVARMTGFAYGTVGNWIKRGRLSVQAAYSIGLDANFALTKEELRPDLTEDEWIYYARDLARKEEHVRIKSRTRKKNAQRIE